MLEREVEELRKVNEIMKLTSVFRPSQFRPSIKALRAFVEVHRYAGQFTAFKNIHPIYFQIHPN